MTDCIPREAVLELVEPDARPFLAERIKSIPAADVREVKKGKWIARHKWDWFVCSKCSYESNKASNYCPTCGADMRHEIGYDANSRRKSDV